MGLLKIYYAKISQMEKAMEDDRPPLLDDTWEYVYIKYMGN